MSAALRPAIISSAFAWAAVHIPSKWSPCCHTNTYTAGDPTRCGAPTTRLRQLLTNRLSALASTLNKKAYLTCQVVVIRLASETKILGVGVGGSENAASEQSRTIILSCKLYSEAASSPPPTPNSRKLCFGCEINDCYSSESEQKYAEGGSTGICCRKNGAYNLFGVSHTHVGCPSGFGQLCNSCYDTSVVGPEGTAFWCSTAGLTERRRRQGTYHDVRDSVQL